MPCPYHPPWLDHSNYIWRRVQVRKLQNVSKLTIRLYAITSYNTVLFTVTAEKISDRFISHLRRLSCYSLRNPHHDLPNLSDWNHRSVSPKTE
jgi:hypothetical protein